MLGYVSFRRTWSKGLGIRALSPVLTFPSCADIDLVPCFGCMFPIRGLSVCLGTWFAWKSMGVLYVRTQLRIVITSGFRFQDQACVEMVFEPQRCPSSQCSASIVQQSENVLLDRPLLFKPHISLWTSVQSGKLKEEGLRFDLLWATSTVLQQLSNFSHADGPVGRDSWNMWLNSLLLQNNYI